MSELAGPVDIATYGEYRVPQRPDDPRPLYRFDGRVPDDTEPGRYHIYAGWFCPWAQRVTIARALAGLEDVVSVSYVDNERDARGWAFRGRYGPDPVNGFTLLRDAYEATDPGFDGHVSVPTLWDKKAGRVLSNNFKHIGIDLATRFRHLADPVIETYPEQHREEIEQLDAWIGPAVNQGRDPTARDAALADLDRRLSERRYLLGDAVTEADIRLYVTLARSGARILEYPRLWDYARDLYTIPAFRDTTDFTTFSLGGADLPDWQAAVTR